MTRIILDTDLGMGQPGSDIDDGFALALALAEPGLSVELVTTVNGNTDVDNATRLTVELLQRLGREVEVVRGAGRPLAFSRQLRAKPAYYAIYRKLQEAPWRHPGFRFERPLH